MEEVLKNFENMKKMEEEQDRKNIDKILDVNLPSPIAQTKIYYRNSWKCNIKRRIWSWILEISIYNFFKYKQQQNKYLLLFSMQYKMEKLMKNYLIW